MSDVDRAKKLYERLGWRLDDDVAPLDGLRIVQFTPRAQEPRSPSPDEAWWRAQATAVGAPSLSVLPRDEADGWLAGGQTALVGDILDQSHLYGVLEKIRNLGLELVSVEATPETSPSNEQE
jgi:hypothetical protein